MEDGEAASSVNKAQVFTGAQHGHRGGIGSCGGGEQSNKENGNL